MPLTRWKRSLPPATIDRWRPFPPGGSRWLVSTFCLVLVAATVQAQTPIERVSENAAGGSEGGRSDGPTVNDNGSVVAFFSDAFDLVPEDCHPPQTCIPYRDVFTRNRDLDLVRRISAAEGGGNTDGPSQFSGFSPAISGDGCLVTFSSDATNLVSDDTNNREDVFLYDCGTETIRRLSIGIDGEANGASNFTDISADGRYIVFQSTATNLIANDTNSRSDIFLFDRNTDEVTRISVASDGSEANRFSIDPAISDDGSVVAFISDATNLVANDTNNLRDVFVHHRESGETTRVSVSSAGVQANDFSFLPSLSSDGNLVAFKSAASTLVPADTNGVPDVFVHDRTTGVTERVSVDSFGNQSQGGLSSGPSISADGRFVAFASFASNFVPGDGNGFSDIFVYDRQTKQIDIVGNALDNGRPGGNVPDYPPSISANGRWIAFASAAENIVPDDINNEIDVFIACNPFDPSGCSDVPTSTPTITPSPTSTPDFGCTGDDDCPAPQVCVDEMCTDPTPTPTRTPTPECADDDDCPSPQVCVAEMCADPTPTPTPTPGCTTDDDCPSPQVCVSQECTDPTPTATPPGYCTSNDDCPANQVCSSNMCTDPTPTPTPPGFCTSNDDCPLNQVCSNNMCTDPTPTPTPPGFCTSNDDCPLNQVCNNNMCSDPTPTPTTNRNGGGGCSVDDGSDRRTIPDALALLLLPGWILWRRRAVRGC